MMTFIHRLPVAQKSTACLQFEKLFVDHITNHLENQGLLDEHQHGFTRGGSTTTQLVTTVQDWAMLENRRNTYDCIYFDYSKAFDRVNHVLLVQKLERYGIGKR